MDRRLEILTRSSRELRTRYSELLRLRSLVEQAEKRRAIYLSGRAIAQTDLRPSRRPESTAFAAAPTKGKSFVNLINSKGIKVGVVRGPAIFNLRGQKLYDLKGINIYRLSGELVGHLPDTQDNYLRLDRSADRLFAVTSRASREQPA